MSRPTSDVPTTGELEILRVFWSSDRPLTVRDVHDQLKKKRALSFTTIATMVRIMMGKRQLKLTDERRPQKFAARLTRQQIVDQFAACAAKCPEVGVTMARTKTIRKTPKLLAEAKKLLDALALVQGEWRVVYACSECKKLQARRYIPYGLGMGVGTTPCMCQAANNHVPLIEVLVGPEVLKDPRYKQGRPKRLPSYQQQLKAAWPKSEKKKARKRERKVTAYEVQFRINGKRRKIKSLHPGDAKTFRDMMTNLIDQCIEQG